MRLRASMEESIRCRGRADRMKTSPFHFDSSFTFPPPLVQVVSSCCFGGATCEQPARLWLTKELADVTALTLAARAKAVIAMATMHRWSRRWQRDDVVAIAMEVPVVVVAVAVATFCAQKSGYVNQTGPRRPSSSGHDSRRIRK
jgi:hypothetical protein